MDDQPYYWMQPDADERGTWAVCMNPNDVMYVVGRLKREEAEEIVERLLSHPRAAGQPLPDMKKD